MAACNEQCELIARVSTAAWGLPCWQPASLELLLQLEIARIPYRLEHCAYPYTPSTGALPALEAATQIIPAQQTLRFLRKYAHDLDQHSDAVDALSYRVLVSERIEPLLLHVLYDDEQNFKSAILPVFGSSLPFPVSAYLPRKVRWDARLRLAALGLQQRKQAAESAEEAMDLFELRLRESGGPFLFGQEPSTADAALAAHLLVCWAAPLRSDSPRDLIVERPHLLKYLRFVASRYLSRYDVCAELDSENPRSARSSNSVAMEDFYDSASDAAKVHFFRFPSSWKLPTSDSSTPEPANASQSNAHNDDAETIERKKEQLELERNNRIAVGAAIGAVISYFLFGGLLSS